MGDYDQVYALYVEKELVGKRVKSSKVKVIWKFACKPNLRTHEVQLKHSIMSGKREVSMDGNLIFHSKKLFQGPFRHEFSLQGRRLTISIEETFDGYVYDLTIDGKPFHRNKRVSVEELETMRKRIKEEEEEKARRERTGSLKEMEYGRFVKHDSGSLDGKAFKSKMKAEKKKTKKDPKPTESGKEPSKNTGDDDFFGSNDWTSFDNNQTGASSITNASTSFAQQTQYAPPPASFNPFDDAPSSMQPSMFHQPQQYHQPQQQYNPVNSQPQYNNQVNSITAGLESLDFSGIAQTGSSGWQYDQSYHMPGYDQSGYSDSYSSSNFQTNQTSGSNLVGAVPVLPSSAPAHDPSKKTKPDDAFSSLVNLNDLTLAPGETASAKSSNNSFSSTSSSNRFQQPMRPSTHTMVTQPPPTNTTGYQPQYFQQPYQQPQPQYPHQPPIYGQPYHPYPAQPYHHPQQQQQQYPPYPQPYYQQPPPPQQQQQQQHQPSINPFM